MEDQDFSDDQIRAILVSHGEPNTPVNPMTRSVLLRKVKQLLQDGGGGEAALSPAASTGGEAAAQQGPAAIAGKECQSPAAINDMSNVQQRKFDSESNIRKFAPEHQSQESICSTNPVLSEKANNFPSLSVPALNKFRKFIEDGDMEKFETTVWDNPRHLIGRGDTPEILKPPLRYNALHCAVRSGHLPICKKLFEILEGDRFWSLVYPDDTPEIRNRRRHFLVDLYLNTCDRGAQDTPLHFAAKLGHEDIVGYLVTFPALDTKAVNKYGETASKIACNGDKKSSSSKKQRILDLLSDPAIYFVPVLRAVDNSVYPKLSHPCTRQQLESPGSGTTIESTVMSSGVAGPMSPLQAKSFYKEWHSPSNGKDVKRSDPDKGMERIGRRLAHQYKVNWKEYWQFLDCSCDLSQPEGLRILEEHLSSTTNTSPAADLEELLASKLTLSTPEREQECGEKAFLAGSEPTKLDIDVLRALEGCKIDPEVYPKVAHWKTLVESFSEEDKKGCGWRTPIKSRNHLQQTPVHYPPSPLIYSSPRPPIERTRLEFSSVM